MKKTDCSKNKSMNQFSFRMLLASGFITAFFILAFSSASSQQEKSDFTSYTESIQGSDIGIEMTPVEGGTFRMGSLPDDSNHKEDEKPAHKTEVSSFWMGKFEITWDQYELYMNSGEPGSLPGQNKGEYLVDADAISRPSKTYIDPSFGMGKGEYPAVSMTHFAALSFARWLTLKTGHFYRLPTEAEWEYACRAGSQMAYHFGDDPEQLDEYAWYYENSNEQYHKVGAKKPNPLGLHDMHGNVAEWTLDQYSPDFYSRFVNEPGKDPWAAPEDLHPRTVRGGSWNDDSENLRCASRLPSNPDRWKRGDPQIPKSLWWNTNAPFVGFRIVRPLEQPSEEEIEKFWEETLDQFYYE